jgi:PKD repeat protein
MGVLWLWQRAVWAASGIASDAAGNIYVADSGNERIQKFDSSGTFITKWGQLGSPSEEDEQNGNFSTPIDVAVDSAGYVYVADWGNHRIQMFDGSGNFVTKWGALGHSDGGEFYKPEGIAAGAGGVYVADTYNNRIQKFSSSGSYLGGWGSSGSGTGQFDLPRKLAVGATGNVYVGDSGNKLVQKFDGAGTFLKQWGSHTGAASWVFGVAADAEGNVYVGGPVTIEKFNSNGTFITAWQVSDGDGRIFSPEDITVDPDRNVYVLTGSNCILKFEYTGPAIPVVNFIGTPLSGTAPLSVQFTDTSTGDPTAWEWDFGDGNTSAIQHPAHTYVSDGRYTVSLTATNYGGSATATETDYIHVTSTVTPTPTITPGPTATPTPTPTPTPAPVANFTGTPTSGTAPLIVNFNDTSTGVPTSWLWHFGDGTNSTLQHPQKIYLTPGTYTVNLTASSAWGSDTSVRSDYITVLPVPAPTPVAYEYLTEWGSQGTGDGDFTYPEGIARDNAGNIYVTETGNHRIQMFNSSGTFITKWGVPGSGDGELDLPGGIAVTAGGNVYVADRWNSRIQKFSSAGDFITLWGSYGSGDGQFDWPYGVAVDAAGNVLVTDINRIQKFDGNGTFITSWGSQGSDDGQFNSPMGIAVDAAGFVYVVDWGNNRIQKFTGSGTFITKWGSQGAGDGQFESPRGIAVDAAGNVYVADSGNHRIQCLTAAVHF